MARRTVRSSGLELSFVAVLGLLALCVAPGCAGADDEDESSNPLENALEDGSLGDLPHLCDELTPQRGKLGKKTVIFGITYNVIQGTDKDDTIEGTPRPDLIFGGLGADKIHSLGGTDIVCAGAGADFVDGGLGADRIYGEGGNDILHGGDAGDWIHGGKGHDEVYGDLLDDKLYGDGGNDTIVGAHGVDHMEGGPGDDWLRGDTNGDDFIGGTGDDTASFVTARPTGKPGRNLKTVMDIDLGKNIANGDGSNEALKGIDKVIGSAFDDAYTGGAGKFDGGYGSDTCNGQPCGKGAPPALPFIYVDARPKDTGVIFLGGDGDDGVVFEHNGGKVIATEIHGSEIHAGPHCNKLSKSVVSCTPGAPLHYLMAWGGNGNDELTVEKGFPRDFNAHLDGGEGDDHLTGGDGDDILFTGRSGEDLLEGGPGDDALISESYSDDRQKPGNAYGGGKDTLLGQNGNDQLVSDYPCGKHFYSGGNGVDIAGFARVGAHPIHAQLSGPIDSGDKSDFYGKAFLPGVCNPDDFGTTLEDNLEILEGSKGHDKLLGNNRDNILWGRQGNDILKGFGGDDILMGHSGKDHVFGGEGDDIELE